ncbi:preprotein translocase subunit YajC [Rhodopseudomonas palustris]|uniref:Preprotein translocase subunit YajC n=1 Tax=Rhodopseudomonas palustris TaxID=1076 RepID=A0A323UR86_RHOPL|nr:preprotein translocase subunit YajC [Rhodopseudomonas palustris]PZA10178.1 preprotein translocase subunit YajC [Rhodopseudomonas palustris]
MAHKLKVTDDMVAKAAAAFRAASGSEIYCLRAALEAALANQTFSVGDEVTTQGGATGIILSINGDEAQISWSCRGKTTTKLSELEHIEHAESVLVDNRAA